MYLSRIEINGFKSFGTKVVLEFAPGVTAIVGPNGSGKSNVVDAIRWVLGEQGYKGIRLEKSDDVIFLGAKGKGKMSRASVEMHLSEVPQDRGVPYEGLSVARHVYRDGEGEYFMNKAAVRLKDILETLARLCISTKNYSIVTQGMSDQLLRFSPQELRVTVEEASGVKEWQLKKRDAERKLKKSGEHAAQVQALLAELKPYLANLRSQMRRWEKKDEYVRRAQELREWKTLVRGQDLARRTQTLDSRRETTRETIHNAEEDKKRLATEIAETEKSLKRENVAVHASQDALLAELYEKRMALERELIRVESQLASRSTACAGAPDLDMARRGVSDLRKLLESAAQETSVERLREMLARATEAARAIERLFGADPAAPASQIPVRQKELKEEIGKLERELDGAKRAGQESYAKEQRLKEALFTRERQLRKTEDDLERALVAESSLMEEQGRLSEEERRLLAEARAAIPDAPDSLEKLLRVLETSHGGKALPDARTIEEELIRVDLRLSDIGELDPNIKAEHDKVEERFSFLTKELADVEQARKDLEKLIVDLERDIREKFEGAFVNVNREFGRYMQTIFGGGHGELVKLAPPKKKVNPEEETGEEEEEEPEEEGIAVHVELPGKRIKSLELLSGGERALTSLAFLFALIAAMKPPFVILDEVDAALDEANSKRFAELLESVQRETQCVIVTHNRSTMQVAGALYGVTMGGDGISRILSLKLEK